jgi:hypothetical protein
MSGKWISLESHPAAAGARSGSGLPVKRLMGFEPTTFCMASSRL